MLMLHVKRRYECSLLFKVRTTFRGRLQPPQRTMPNSNPSVRQSGHITMMWRVWLTFWYYRVASHHYKVTGP